MTKRTATQCRKPKGAYCKIHNPAPVSGIVEAQAKVEALFREPRSRQNAANRQQSYDETMQKIHQFTSDVIQVDKLIPVGSRGELIIPSESPLGTLYDTMLKHANTGEETALFKYEYEEAVKDNTLLQQEIDFLEEKGEATVQQEAELRAGLLKVQLIRLGYFISRSVSSRYPEWLTVVETTEDYQEKTTGDYDQALILKDKFLPPDKQKVIAGYLSYRDLEDNNFKTVAEIITLDGKYSSRVDVNGYPHYIPLIISSNSQKYLTI